MKEQAVRQAKDLLITVLILTAATGIGNIFWYFSFTKNIISVYILGTLLTSLFTKSYFYGFLSSFSSVLLFNFCFTEPRLTLHAYERGYPVTFAIMLIVSIITVTLAIQRKSALPSAPRMNSCAPICCARFPTTCVPR